MIRCPTRSGSTVLSTAPRARCRVNGLMSVGDRRRVGKSSARATGARRTSIASNVSAATSAARGSDRMRVDPGQLLLGRLAAAISAPPCCLCRCSSVPSQSPICFLIRCNSSVRAASWLDAARIRSCSALEVCDRVDQSFPVEIFPAHVLVQAGERLELPEYRRLVLCPILRRPPIAGLASVERAGVRDQGVDLLLVAPAEHVLPAVVDPAAVVLLVAFPVLDLPGPGDRLAGARNSAMVSTQAWLARRPSSPIATSRTPSPA